MKALGKLVITGVAAVAVLGVAGCGERPQVVVYKQGKYQGKPDTPPWQSAPLEGERGAPSWEKGNKESWELTLRTRTLNQNEHTRTE